MSKRSTSGGPDAFAKRLQQLEDAVRNLQRPQSRTAGVQQYGPQLQVGDLMLEQVTLPSDPLYPATPQLRVRNVKTGFSSKLPVGAYAAQVNLAGSAVTVATGSYLSPGNVTSAQITLPKAARYWLGWGAYFTSTVAGWGFAAAGPYYTAPNAGVTSVKPCMGQVSVLGDANFATFNGTASGEGLFDARLIATPVTIVLALYKNAAGGTVAANTGASWLSAVEIP